MHFQLNSGNASPEPMLPVGHDFLQVSQNRHISLLKMTLPSTFLRRADTVFFRGLSLFFTKNGLELASFMGFMPLWPLYAFKIRAANSSDLARSISFGRPSLILSQ